MMRESDAGGIASRAMGSAVHMGQLGIGNNNNYRRYYFLNKQQQSQMVVSGQGDGLCDACGTAGTGRLPWWTSF